LPTAFEMVNQAQAMNFFHFDNQNRAFYVDDKYKKLEQQERAEERRKIMWLCVKGVLVVALVGGVLFFLSQQYEKLKSKMLESPVVSLYLSNGCRGERIDISQVSGRQRQRGTMQVREVSFCDLQFADNVPANDQVRSSVTCREVLNPLWFRSQLARCFSSADSVNSCATREPHCAV